MSTGDYRLFRAGSGQIRSLETDRQFAKARHWRPFLPVSGTFSLSAGLPGWGGRIRTSAWWNQNPLPACEVSALVGGAISLRSLATVPSNCGSRRLDMDATVALQPYVGGKCGHAQGHRIQDRGRH
jgi:hypothetical protein